MIDLHIEMLHVTYSQVLFNVADMCIHDHLAVQMKLHELVYIYIQHMLQVIQ